MPHTVTIEQAKINPDKMDTFIRENVGLIRLILKKFDVSPNIYDEVWQSALVTLYTSVSHFDPTKNIQFSTYASQCIYCSIATTIANCNNQATLPMWLTAAKKELEQGKTIEEVAKQHKSRLTAFKNALALGNTGFFSDLSSTDDEDRLLEYTIPDTRFNPEEIVIDKIRVSELHFIIDKVVSEFKLKHHREWVYMYIDGMIPFNIARAYHISRQEVSRVIIKFRKMLKNRLEVCEKYKIKITA